MTIIGIDLGTTNSLCSIWQNGKVVLIPNRLGSFQTPSVVSIDEEGGLVVGEIAKYKLITHPGSTISLFKRFMGTDWSAKLGNKLYTAVELSSFVLRSLKEDAEHFTGKNIESAVISVPAYFNDNQRQATKLAAQIAGLKVERLINEPTAACLEYGFHKNSNGKKYIILDMGGGTFDVSIVEYFDGVIEIHASSGDNFLGGEDFLNLLVDEYLKIQNISKKDLSSAEKSLIYHTFEKIKCELSKKEIIDIHEIIPSKTKPWTLTREMFADMSKPLLLRAQNPVERALMDSAIDLDEIQSVIMVGGATNMHCFRHLVARMFRMLPTSTTDPALAVAMGAGIQAGLREKNIDLDDIVLTDVAPYTLGTGVINLENPKEGDLFLPIIERNTTVPVSKEVTVRSVYDNQEKCKVQVYQGESYLVSNNVLIGTIDVTLPIRPANLEIIIRYSYDMNGILDVDVTVPESKETFCQTIVNSPTSLTNEEIEKSKLKLKNLKFHPRDQEENILLLTKLEKIYEESLGELRMYVMSIINNFKGKLNGQNNSEIEREKVKILEFIKNHADNSGF